MRIQGLTQYGTDGLDINKSSGPFICTIDNARSFGPSVCDDVIQIPVNSGTDVQVVQISVYNNFLTLCEVQVFAGKLIDNSTMALTYFESHLCIHN